MLGGLGQKSALRGTVGELGDSQFYRSTYTGDSILFSFIKKVCGLLLQFQIHQLPAPCKKKKKRESNCRFYGLIADGCATALLVLSGGSIIDTLSINHASSGTRSVQSDWGVSGAGLVKKEAGGRVRSLGSQHGLGTGINYSLSSDFLLIMPQTCSGWISLTNHQMNLEIISTVDQSGSFQPFSLPCMFKRYICLSLTLSASGHMYSTADRAHMVFPSLRYMVLKPFFNKDAKTFLMAIKQMKIWLHIFPSVTLHLEFPKRKVKYVSCIIV